jgi:hypothetical protein
MHTLSDPPSPSYVTTQSLYIISYSHLHLSQHHTDAYIVLVLSMAPFSYIT